MPLNLNLINNIANNNLTETLILSGNPDYGAFGGSRKLFWSFFRAALAKNKTISQILFHRQDIDTIENLLPALQILNNRGPLHVMFSEQDAKSIEKLLPLLESVNGKVSRLTLYNQDADSIEKLLPCLQNVNSKITALTLQDLSAASLEKLLPVMQNSCQITGFTLSGQLEGIEKLLSALQQSNRKACVLGLGSLSEASLEKLLPSLQDPQSKITHLTLNREFDGVEKLLPSLQDANSRINSLHLANLPTAKLEKLLPVLRNPNSKITELALSKQDIPALEKLLPAIFESKVSKIRLNCCSEEALNYFYQRLLLTNRRKLIVEGDFSQEWKVKFQQLRLQPASVTTQSSVSQNINATMQSLIPRWVVAVQQKVNALQQTVIEQGQSIKVLQEELAQCKKRNDLSSSRSAFFRANPDSGNSSSSATSLPLPIGATTPRNSPEGNKRRRVDDVKDMESATAEKRQKNHVYAIGSPVFLKMC